MPVVLVAVFAVSLAAVATASASSLALTATNATIGGPIEGTATLSGNPLAGGEITFQVFDTGDPLCLGAPVATLTTTAPVSGEGAYPSTQFVPGAPGEYRWAAHYSGNLEDPPADAPCGSAASTVSKAVPGLALTATSAPVGVGVHAEAVLAGGFSPGGTVTFNVYAPGGCAIPARLPTTVALQNGRAVAPDYVTAAAGSYGWSAEYSGDGNNEAVSSAPCEATSVAGKATPTLSGTAGSAAAGRRISDSVTLAAGFAAGGQLVFRSYGPDDRSCAGAPAYEAQVPVNGDGNYSPPGFAPAAGLYRWVVGYSGDANNEARVLPCGADNQSSAVGTVPVVLTGSATSGVVGTALTATAVIAEGAVPGGRLTFTAFAAGDATCTGPAALTSTVTVAGNGSYRSAPLVPTRAGAYRWKIAYSGDANHLPGALACGAVTANVAAATPSIVGHVKKRPSVGSPFSDTAYLAGAFAPTGKVTFKIYLPGNTGCGKPDYTDTVAFAAGTVVNSDPFVAKRAGRYTFVTSYSGDAANAAAVEPCGAASQVALVGRRKLVVKPRATVSGRRISLGARIGGGLAPSGSLGFRLYGPGDVRCKRPPVFRGKVSAHANGTYTLAEYLASRPGIYRLAVAYSGDPRNLPVAPACARAEQLRVR